MDGRRFDDTTRSMFRNRRGVLTGSAALALAAQGLFDLAERFVVPKGLLVAAGKSGG